MRSGNRLPQAAFAVAVLMMLVISASASTSATAANSPDKHSSSKIHKASAHHKSSKHSSKKSAKIHGQRMIDGDRTVQIQQALIREHYLTGEPTGLWDQASKDAMTRYQADNGWQTKLTPDSRALIKLGLGPDHKGLLNPETAVIPSPHELGGDSQGQPGGSSADQR